MTGCLVCGAPLRRADTGRHALYCSGAHASVAARRRSAGCEAWMPAWREARLAERAVAYLQAGELLGRPVPSARLLSIRVAWSLGRAPSGYLRGRVRDVLRGWHGQT